MGEVVNGVPWNIFISVEIAMFSFILAIGIIALTNKVALASDVKHNTDKFIEYKLDTEKIRAENKLEIEKTKAEHKAELEKIRDKKSDDIIFFTEALSKLNTTLNRLEVNMKGFEGTINHSEKTLENINKSLEKHGDRLSHLERDK
jgi:flagellar motility protein MotE (MotC chaperone)